MSIEVRDSRLASVVDSAAALEKIATGFLFTEGPLWHPRDQCLLFTDIPGSHVRRWSQKDGVSTFSKPSNMTNGLAWDRQGNLLSCEHASSQVTLWKRASFPPPSGPQENQSANKAGNEVTLTATRPQAIPLATHYQGKQLNSPNDIVCSPEGQIYFTDPPFGRMEYYGIKREQELAFQGVYRVSDDPKHPVLLVDDFDKPNGLCFSLDYRRLFINDTARQHIRVFDVKPDGSISSGKVWAETKGEGAGAPDGMKIDSQGNVYCCGPGGIHVFGADALCLGVIRMPEYTANMGWGDADFRSLYIAASTSIYRIRVQTPGLPSMA